METSKDIQLSVAVDVDKGKFQVSDDTLQELGEKIALRVPISEYSVGNFVAVNGYVVGFKGKVIRLEEDQTMIIGMAEVVDVESPEKPKIISIS